MVIKRLFVTLVPEFISGSFKLILDITVQVFTFGFCIRVNNIRHVAILFDTLLEHSFIQAKWQSVLSSGRFLQTKDGKGFVSASSLSSALSALRNNMTSTGYGIRRAIDELREW